MTPVETQNRATQHTLWTSGEVLSGCGDVAAKMGFSAEYYLRRHGLDPEMIGSARGLVPFQAVSEFLEDVSESENRPDFGFRLGLAQLPMQYGMISQLPAISATIGEAFDNFIRYQQLYSQSSHWELLVEDGVASMRRHDVSYSAKAQPQLVNLSIALAFRAIRSIAGPQWQPIAIYLDNDVCPARDDMRRAFDAPVFSNSMHNEIAFAEEDLVRPVATSNPELLAVLRRHFDELLHAPKSGGDLSSRVFNMIRSNLGNQHCTLDWIAQRMRMHPRTVQRALVDEGTTFRELLRDARVELAEYLLRLTRTPISEISAMLGYSNVSAFSRAFEQAKGLPPTAERQRARLTGGRKAGDT